MGYGADALYVRGVRYKFLLFTVGLGVFFDTFCRNAKHQCIKSHFFKLLKVYWLLIIPFCLLGYGAYSDRFLFPAWSYLSYLGAIVLKIIDEKYKPSILWWLLGVYVVTLAYFIYGHLLATG